MTRATCRDRTGQAGLAVIDLMAVAMIVSILVAIAIPAFIGFHRTAQDRAAQSEIDRVLDSERAVRLDRGEYTDAAVGLPGLDPEVLVGGSDPQAGVTLTLNSSVGTLCIERTSGSGATFAVWESAEQGTFYGRGGGLTGACPEAPPAGYSNAGW